MLSLPSWIITRSSPFLEYLILSLFIPSPNSIVSFPLQSIIVLYPSSKFILYVVLVPLSIITSLPLPGFIAVSLLSPDVIIKFDKISPYIAELESVTCKFNRCSALKLKPFFENMNFSILCSVLVYQFLIVNLLPEDFSIIKSFPLLAKETSRGSISLSNITVSFPPSASVLLSTHLLFQKLNGKAPS